MSHTKFLASLLLALALVAVAAGPALAAQETEPVTGKVDAIEIVTDPATDEVTVEVTLTNKGGVAHTYTISTFDALELELILDETTINEEKLDAEVTIEADMIIVDEEDAAEDEAATDGEHPIARLLADFFGVDYEVIDEMRTDGTGFGVITQACWASYQLAGDASLCQDIATAKQTGDYSAFELPDGSTPTNWGQFLKAVKQQRSNLDTLGAINSGRAGKQAGDVQPPDKKNNHPNNGRGPDPDKKNNHPNNKK